MKRIFVPLLAIVVLAAGPASAQGGEEPVVRAQGGNMGFMFVFGGLATLVSTGYDSWNNAATHNVGLGEAKLDNFNTVYSEFGLKYMLNDAVALYGTFGVGMLHYAPENDEEDKKTTWGMTITGGMQYHFRIWRRISPYIGASLSLGGLDPTGKSNGQFYWGVGLPHVGVEYFWGDRASLSFEYKLTLGLIHQIAEHNAQEWTGFGFGTNVSHGGNLQLTFYF